MILPLKNQPLEMIKFSQNYYSTNLTRRLKRLDDELNSVIEKHNFNDILDLFHAVAIR